jgi:hypothetical protein
VEDSGSTTNLDKVVVRVVHEGHTGEEMRVVVRVQGGGKNTEKSFLSRGVLVNVVPVVTL